LIKLVQQEVGMGTDTVRAPRFPAMGALREGAMEVIQSSLATNPFADVKEKR